MNIENFTTEGNRILVVDDEPVTRMMLRQVLENSRYLVLEAEDGARGIELCLGEQPDLVLMDVRMPSVNGFDACKAIRRSPQSRHIPVLMLTGLDDVLATQLAFDAGATDFITKPINWPLLAERVRYALRSRHTERLLRESEERLARAQRIARLGYWRYDLRTDRISFSPELGEALALDGQMEMPARAFLTRVHEDDRQRARRFFFGVMTGKGGPIDDGEFRVILDDGSIKTFRVSAEAATDSGPTPRAMFGVVQDVTERREAEARLSYYAHYDALTGLPNRVLFRDRAIQAMGEAQRLGQRLALVLIDLDRFKHLNVSLGDRNADRVLRAVAHRQAELLRDGDTLSRQGGDEFAILLTGFNEEQDIAPLVRRLLQSFETPVHVDGWDIMVSASMGIAVYPADGEDVDTLLMHAQASLAVAKEEPGSTYHYYTVDMNQRALERLAKETALYQATERREFTLHYQPRIDLRAGRVTGVEALLRWQHPALGLLPPNQFVGLLEETGLIIEVGDWVIRRACSDLRDCGLELSVNLSPRQLSSPGLTDRIFAILEDTGLAPERLELEITENFLMQDAYAAVRVLTDLRQRGIRVSIDDYGTGYSSLAYLKQMPVNILKIDRSFVCNLTQDAKDAAIVSSTIELGHNLGITLVAEGVEDQQTMERLMEYGCDAMQGFHLARPQALCDLVAWLALKRDPSTSV